ncbi:MAG TPA: alpha/beta hydrolase, partial [Firmicutes bacterium]|nr:alpha/beta hydrolase [Bacillota bacterium]
MSKTNELIQTIQSHKIYTSTTLPDSPARANILLVHGLGEHCARYAHVSAFFSENEIATYTFDLPGHGKSDGKRGVMRYQKAWKIIDQLKTSIAAGNPGTPLFLYGHSLGGALALTYAARFPD